MGVYADSYFDLEFPSVSAAHNAMEHVYDSLSGFHHQLGEDGETIVEHKSDGKVTLSGYTHGRAYGGLWPEQDEISQQIAEAGAEGTIDWIDGPDERWRLRFANGTVTAHQAVVTVEYPTDRSEVNA